MNRGQARRTHITLLTTVASLAAFVLTASPAIAERPMQIDAGNGSTYAVIDTGGIRCWGYNGSDGLGDGSTDEGWVPVRVLS